MGLDAGPARDPRRGRTGARSRTGPPARALRGRRRRVRTEAGDVRRVQPRGQSRADARPAGEVGRDPVREHARDAPRPRPGHLRRARPQARRHDRRSARAHDRRRGRVSRRRRVPAVLHADDVAAGVPNAEDRLQLAGGDDQHHADRGVPRRRSPGGDASRRTHARHRRRRARHRSGRHPPHELHPERRVPVHDGHRRNVRLGRLREAARRGARARGLRRAASRAGGAPRTQRSDAARHRSGFVRRDHRAGRAAPRVGQGRDRRRRHRARVRRYQLARPGPRDRVLDDRERRARRTDGAGDGPAVRHRDHPAGRWHRRLSVAPDRRERGQGRERRGVGAGQAIGGAPARSQPRRHRDRRRRSASRRRAGAHARRGRTWRPR